MEITDQPPGGTPLREEDLRGLKLNHVSTREQLDEAESLNIAEARAWIEKNWNQGVLDESFLFRLHKEMFSNVWKWAGQQRKHELENPKFCPYHRIVTSLRELFSDIDVQVRERSVAPDDLAVRFHHRLVLIHPCANGNGRLTRELTDIQLRRIGIAPFTWNDGSLGKPGPRRQRYLEALHAADDRDYSLLLKFARS